MIFKMIAAVDRNGFIGKDNALPWKIGSDMQFFKRMTSRHIVIMGRKTHESIGSLLPHRENWILSNKHMNVPEAECFTSIDQLIDYSNTDYDPKTVAWIIGGAQIYEQMLPYISQLYLTHVDVDIEGDVQFPEYKHLIKSSAIIESFGKSQHNQYSGTIWQYQLN